jgi:hypothetical protein
MRFPGRFNTASLVIAIDSWPLGLAQIPWPHPNSYARPRCDPKTARLNTRNRLLNYFVPQPDSPLPLWM